MAPVLLNKLLDGRSTSFARSDGGSLVVSVNGHERAVSPDLWRSLPELEAAERYPPHHVASARTRLGTNRAGRRVKIARGQRRLDYWVRIVSVRALDHRRVVAE